MEKAKKKEVTLKAVPSPRPTRKRDVLNVIDEINMRYGVSGPIARTGADAWDASDLRRPSGIASLDVAMGGGLVAGKVHQVSGPEGIGKNFLLYQFFARQQELYGDKACLAMACFESFVDKQFAQMCGCKIAMSPYDIETTQRAREMYGEPPMTDEEIRDALECPQVGEFVIFQGPAENVLDGIVMATKSNTFQLIGIDSWDVMQTASEDTKDLDEDPKVASASMIQTRWSKKILDAFNPIFICPECGSDHLEKVVIKIDSRNYRFKCKNCEWHGKKPDAEVNETSIYCIRQVREKLMTGGGKVMGRKYDAQGARALRHLNHIHLQLNPGAFVKEKNIKVGKEVSWEIKKAKAGAKEGATGTYILNFNPLGVDLADDVLGTALNVGTATYGGSKYNFHFMGESIKGRDNTIKRLEEDMEFRNSVEDRILIDAGLGHVRLT